MSRPVSRGPSRPTSNAAAPGPGSRASQGGFGPQSSFGPPGPLAPQSMYGGPRGRTEPPPLTATAGPLPGTIERPIAGPKKRLIVTCDGTWLDADNGLVNGQAQPPSNVSRIGWAMKTTSRDGIPQIVHYQAGVGTMGGAISRFIGGAVGGGLKENVREAYSYLSVNYREGDEIFLIGFSRGAYTARSVGGMIGDLGLLTKAGLPYFSEIFEDYQHRHDDRYVSKFPDQPFANKPPFLDPKYVEGLRKNRLTVLGVPIKAVCVWETVGSLGVPRIPWLERLGLQSRRERDYCFWDTQLYDGIEHAFQALALDERRAPFAPALWEKPKNSRTELIQVWFPGVHSNVGGGYDDQDLSNNTLAWMISKLEPFIDFNPNYIQSVYDSNRAYYKSTGQKPRWWSFGELYNSLSSLSGAYRIAGTATRTPGAYYRVDPMSGRPTDKRLKNTYEYIHASARARTGLNGPGTNDVGVYDSRALANWTFEPGHFDTGPNAANASVIWTNHSEMAEGQKTMPEAPLSRTELILLSNSPKVEDYLKDMRPPRRKGKRRSRNLEKEV